MTDVSLYPSSFWRRVWASFLDGLIFTIPISLLLGGLLDMDTTKLSEKWWFQLTQSLYLTIVPIIWSGYTVGKRIAGVRIVKADGTEAGAGTLVLREIVGKYLLATVTFGLSAIVSAFMVGLRKDKRAIHDFIAGTAVVYR